MMMMMFDVPVAVRIYVYTPYIRYGSCLATDLHM